VIQATLQRSGEMLRLSLLTRRPSTTEEFGVTVTNLAEAEREVAAFSKRYPGRVVQRRGGAWPDGEC
jgi:hypothetical protein